MTSDAHSVVVSTAAPPRGRYPHVRRAGDFVFVSGLSSRRPDGSIAGVTFGADGLLPTLDIAEQTCAVIENIAHVLGAVNGSLADIVEFCAYLVDMNDFPAYNTVYSDYFAESGPARTTVAVHALPHPHFRIEAKVIAYLPVKGTIFTLQE
jgi:2-aminomuconate deaminase